MAVLANLLWRPSSTYLSVGDWARATQNESSLKSFSPPTGLSPDREWLLQLAGGKVIGDARLVASAQNEVIGQLQGLHGIERPAEHWMVRQKRLRWTVALPGVSFLIGVGSGGNYFHWLFEALPRLDYLRRAGVGLDTIDQFVINEDSLPFHHQTLDLLNIPVSKRIHCSKRRVIQAETLLVSPMPSLSPGDIVPWVCEFLRNSFLSAGSAKSCDRRLYLSRRGSPKRRLANEAAVENLFREHGFEIVRLEELPFREQVATFASASRVAGPHGAGFANLVFSPPATGIIEFFHPNHRAANYENIARLLGMNYRCVLGEASGETGNTMSEKLGPYAVSFEELEAALKSLDTT